MAVAVDPRYIQNLTERINEIKDCSDLTEWAEKELLIWQTEMQKLVAAIAILEILMNPPSPNLNDIVEWLSTIATMYSQQYANTLIAIAEITAAYAQLSNAILQKAAQLNCTTVIIPTLPSV